MKSLSVAMLLLAAGCLGTEGAVDAPDLAPPPVPHNFAQINSIVFQTSCAFSVCHSTRGAHSAAKLDLTLDAYHALVKVAANNDEAKKAAILRVKPCDPNHSFLISKLEEADTNNDSMTGFGAHMPLKNPTLPPEQLQAVRDWVARGALMDEPEDATGTTCMVK